MIRAMLRGTTTALLLTVAGCGRTPLVDEPGSRPASDTGGTSEQLQFAGGGRAGAIAAGGTLGTGGTSQSTTASGGAGFTGGTGGGTGGTGTGGEQSRQKTALWIATGSAHTCAVLSDGTVECWGMNDSGELGDGTFTHRSSPVKVQGISNARMVTTGYDHTCAILDTGVVQCWGSNAQGQLGNGSSVSSAIPVTVTAMTNAVDLDIGGIPGHGCALASDALVYCWGNAYSDPNDINNDSLALPRVVSGLTRSSAKAVSVGAKHSCALLTTGAVACWGDDVLGQLGSATTTSSSAPIPIVGVSSAVALAAGGNSTCVITADSRVQCWGSNTDEQLGNAALTATGASSSATPVTVDFVASASKLAVGSMHACAVIADGSLRCWGSNSGGELGDGSVTLTDKGAVTVTGMTNVTSIAAGGHHTCAIIDKGRVACWGSNLLGQLGNGNTVDSAVPLTVRGY